MARNKIAPNQTLKSSWIAKAGILLVIAALVIMESSNAAAAQPGGGAQQTNWSTVTKLGIGGSIGALGLGGLICGILTVGCPIGIAIAGGVLGAIGGTIALFPEPAAPSPVLPANWPDAPSASDPCGISCGGSNGGGSAGGGGSGFGQGPDDIPQPERPSSVGHVKTLMAIPGRSNALVTAAKHLAHSFDWRQSAFDTVHQGLLDRQHSGLFVGAPVTVPRLTWSPARLSAIPLRSPLARPR